MIARLAFFSLLTLFAHSLQAAELGDEGDTEAAATDQMKCEGQCVNSRFNQSKARLSRAEVLDLAQRLLDRGETPKVFEDTKAVKDRRGP